MSVHGLSAHQHAVVTRVMAEEDAHRLHLVVSISGAHAYGFPSPDSDVDLKAIHVARGSELAGLRLPPAHSQRLEVVDGVEIDYSSNELGGVLQGVLQGNGNYVERILGGVTWSAHPLLDEVAPIVRRVLSRRMHRHYHGFASGQFRVLMETPQKTVKKVLYVLRTALTGTHALLTGEIVPSLPGLADRYGFKDVSELVTRKTAGERTPMTDGEVNRWVGRLQDALRTLDDACARSPLPVDPSGEAELDAWLREVRRRHWD